MGKWVNCHIYDMNYLINKELTEDDLHNLFETPSLNSSLILEMFRFVGDTRQNWEIMKMAKTEDKWCDNYTWTYNQKTQFLNNLIKVFKNVYQVGDLVAKHKAEWWLLYFGFLVTDPKHKRRKRNDKTK